MNFKNILPALLAVEFLVGCSTTEPVAVASAPANALTSATATKAAIADKKYNEFSNSLQVNMVTIFGSDNVWSQSPPGKSTSKTPIRFEVDGRVCNLRNRFCFYVRPVAGGFEMLRPDGSVAKTLTEIGS